MSSSRDNAKQHIQFSERSASILLLLSTIAVLLGERRFVKLKIGPIFALEVVLYAVFALWIFGFRNELKRLKSLFVTHVPHLIFPILFFFVGALRMAGDLGHLGSMPLGRILQHSLIFVYPLVWMSCGYILETKNTKWADEVVIGALLAQAIPTMPRIQHTLFWNISIGPIVIVPAFLSIFYGYQQRLLRFQLIGFGLLCLFLSFFGFWSYWGADSLSRTSFLSLTLFLCLPIVFSLKSPNLIPVMKTAVTAGIVFFLGIAANTAWNSQAKNLDIQHQIIKSFQHTDDISHKYLDPKEDETKMLHFRTRKFLWSTAISDWRVKPIFGIGWVPEFPSFIEEGHPNTIGFETGDPLEPPAPPINGAHNSYLTILARVGIVGALVFLGLIVILARDCVHVLREIQPLAGAATLRNWLTANSDHLVNLTLVATVLSGAVYALFNVCLESPQYCMITWLFAGIITARSAAQRTKYAKLH